MSRTGATSTARVLGEEGIVELGSPPWDRLREDRARLAYAIHDGLTQVVTASVLELDWLSRQAETGPQEAVAALRTAVEGLRGSLDEIRGILASLTPLQEVVPSIDELLREVTERWHRPARWSIEGDLQAVPAPIVEAACALIREGFANAVKHGDPDEIEVRVRASGAGLWVSVRDDGKGFRPDAATNGAGHLGLEMVRHRVSQARGILDVESAPGRGTRLLARFPASTQGTIP